MLKPLLRINSLLVVLFALLITACSDGVKAPDVSGVEVKLLTRRLDQDIAKLDTANIAAGLTTLRGKYPDFLDFYLDTLMGLELRGNYNDSMPGINMGMRSFLTHKDYRGLLDTVAKHYPDTKDIDDKLAQGFKYMKHYNPNYKIPNIVYLVSWLNNWAAFTYDTTIGIGLDMFLGGSYPYYQSVGIPAYMAPQLSKTYIPVAVFKAIHREAYPFERDNKNLLDMMIQRGKEQYFLAQILPNQTLNERLAFTKAQLDWCEQNEAQVYNFFLQQNMLYETNWQKILRYVHDGPSATGMAPESPGNVGSWLGYRIIEAYMAQHGDMDLQKLLADKTASATLLQQSKYKPK